MDTTLFHQSLMTPLSAVVHCIEFDENADDGVDTGQMCTSLKPFYET